MPHTLGSKNIDDDNWDGVEKDHTAANTIQTLLLMAEQELQVTSPNR